MHMHIHLIVYYYQNKTKNIPSIAVCSLTRHVSRHIFEALGERIMKVYVSGMLLNYTWNKDILFKLIYNFT
jgi:hypothetical protein